MLPLRPGQVERHTHDYRRNGITNLFAVLEVATGRVVTDWCYDRHGRAEFLDVLERVAKAYHRRELHVILDNYHTHKHDDIGAWLAQNPRVTLHFTPTSGSWLNLVEVFLGIIRRQAIRRGSFSSVPELVAEIRPFIDGSNERCHPFAWTKTADQILPSATRQRSSDAGHWRLVVEGAADMHVEGANARIAGVVHLLHERQVCGTTPPAALHFCLANGEPPEDRLFDLARTHDGSGGGGLRVGCRSTRSSRSSSALWRCMIEHLDALRPALHTAVCRRHPGDWPTRRN